MNSNADKGGSRRSAGSIGPWIKREGLALLVDLYELTMLAGYQATGRAQQRACFEYFFRELPTDNGFAVSAGLEQLLDFLEALRFEKEDLEYLAGTGIFVLTDFVYASRMDMLPSLGKIWWQAVIFLIVIISVSIIWGLMNRAGA